MVCEQCHKETRIIVKKGDKYVCFECSKHRPIEPDPPSVKLFRKWGTSGIYHSDTNLELLNFDRTAKICDFRLYISKEFLNKEKSPKKKETLIFRYFGEKKCALIQNYKWPKGTKACADTRCMNFY